MTPFEPVVRRVEQSLAAARHCPAAFTMLLARQAIDAARDLDRAEQPPPLRGIVFTAKDNFDLAGQVTAAGSKVLASRPAATSTAPAVQRLMAAGAVLIGRTTMTELAFSGLGLNPHYGTPSNPRYPPGHRTPGGSSSGAAVSVAIGAADVALGTDTGGSIRIPAAFCGLVGFKASADAIGREGVFPLSPTLDSLGLIGRTVEGCARAFDAIRSSRPRSDIDTARPPVLGVVRNHVREREEQVVSGAVAQALDRLRAAGWIIEEVAIAAFDAIPGAHARGSFPAAELWTEIGALAEAEPDSFDPRVLERIRSGARMSATDYVRLVRFRETIVRAYESALEGRDALVWPTVPIVAPALADLADAGKFRDANALVLRNGTVVNLANGCAISLPCVAPEPVGITLAMRGGDDDRLLRLAERAEAIMRGWRSI